ncbi:MAG: hypothetical protein AAGA56_06995 [Myxococcota bacterium]
MSKSPAAIALSIGLIASACNAEQVTFDDDDDGGSTDSPSGGGVDGGGPGDTPGPGVTPEALVPADGIVVERVVAYQGIERPIMEFGEEATSSIPLIAERPALVRVFYNAEGPASVTARLSVDDEVLEVTGQVSGRSDDGRLSSTLNFEVPPELMRFGARYRVDVLQTASVSAGGSNTGRYPTDVEATFTMPFERGEALDIVLVPVRYTADGSGRLPDVSDIQIAAYREEFMARYPVTEVNLTVRMPIDSIGPIQPNGAGWSEILERIREVRELDRPAPATYYYGIFSPTPSLGSFCGRGCVAGLGFLPDPSFASGRVAVGLGYSGADSIETAVHEIGHNHGRQHAPCGVRDSDRSFPHSNGRIGAYGYHLFTGEIKGPSTYNDMMGYCDPTWVSDYTYEALANRIAIVGAQSDARYAPEDLDRVYDRFLVDGEGRITKLDPMTFHRPPTGSLVETEVVTEAGQRITIEGHFYRYDHLPGGTLIVPQERRAGVIEAKLEGNWMSIHPTFK